MKTYNKENAYRLAREFEQLVDIDLKSGNRVPRNVALRTLFYKVLRDKNEMKENLIQDWFTEIGNKKDRTSIYISLTKIELYYYQFDCFKEAYDTLFPDEPIKLKKKKKAFKVVLDDDDSNTLKRDRDALEVLIDGLEGSRRQEIYELVNLRIKSWSWKSKDQCEIIECSEHISSFAH